MMSKLGETGGQTMATTNKEETTTDFTLIPGHKTKFRIIKEGSGPDVVQANNNVTGIIFLLYIVKYFTLICTPFYTYMYLN